MQLLRSEHGSVEPAGGILMPLSGWDRTIATRVFDLEVPDRLVVGAAPHFQREGFQKVIDIGCGLGRHVAYLAGAGFSVLGVDIAHSAVEATRELVSEFPQAEVVAGDATALELPSESFDLALAWRMIHLADARQVADILGEIYRVLRPGGVLFCSIRSISNALYPKALAEGLEIEPNTFVMGTEGLNGLVYHFFTREEVIATFSRYFEIELVEEKELEHTSYTSGSDGWGNWFWILNCRKK